MRIMILIAMFCFSSIAYAANYPKQFDSNGLVSYFHHLGQVKFKSVYDGQRIIIHGKIRHVDYAPVGAHGAWISIDMKHENDKGPFNQLTLWFARKYEPMVKSAANEIKASCIVRPGIRLPSLWNCEPTQKAKHDSFTTK